MSPPQNISPPRPAAQSLKATDLFLVQIFRCWFLNCRWLEATPELLALAGEEGAAEPYRYLMKNLRSRLMATQAWLEARRP